MGSHAATIPHIASAGMLDARNTRLTSFETLSADSHAVTAGSG
jgi:hypothetical protein